MFSIKILLANDHRLLLDGIRTSLATINPHIRIIGEAECFNEIIEKLRYSECNILMSEDRMQGEYLLMYLPGIKKQN